jgi:hypothetical protein
MRKLLVVVLPATVLVLALASFASGGARATSTLSAVLNAGQEVPHAKGTMSGASGRFTGTLSNGTLKWRLTFAHLTGPATAAHIHVGVKGKSGAVLVPLCGPCKSGASGTVKLANPVALSITSKPGATYVNVHTAKNPGGEIRGQLTVR